MRREDATFDVLEPAERRIERIEVPAPVHGQALDTAVAALDEDHADFLPKLPELQVRWRHGTWLEAVRPQKGADAPRVSTPGNNVDVRVRPRHVADEEVESPASPEPETDPVSAERLG